MEAVAPSFSKSCWYPYCLDSFSRAGIDIALEKDCSSENLNHPRAWALKARMPDIYYERRIVPNWLTGIGGYIPYRVCMGNNKKRKDGIFPCVEKAKDGIMDSSWS